MKYIYLLILLSTFIFGGNAAYLEVKFNYLSPNHKVIVGQSNDKDERVEILISLLDANGQLATADIKGDYLKAIEITSSQKAKILTEGSLSGSRTLDGGKNIGRYVLDYSDVTTTSLQKDEIIVKAGGKEVRKNITLDSIDAKGLVLRAAPYSEFLTQDYVNEYFNKIQMRNEPTDYNLSTQSSRSPGGVSGVSIPIEIYASSVAPSAKPQSGRFTLAPNLEGKHIVVKALGDFDLDGKANVIISTNTFRIVRGIARGNILIKHSLPLQSKDVKAFEPSLVGGLPVTFVAYVQGDEEIATMQNINLDKPSTINVVGEDNATDSVKIRSSDPKDIKLGLFNPSATKIQDLWMNDRELFVANGASNPDFNPANANLEVNATITVVDNYGNPAYIADASLPDGVIVKFNDDETSSKSFSCDKYFDNTNQEKNITNTAKVLKRDFDQNITYAVFLIKDKDDNITKSQTIDLDFRRGILALSNVLKTRISHLPLVMSEKTGNSVVKDHIKTQTNKDTVKVVKAYNDTTTTAQSDLKIRLTASRDATKIKNKILELRIYDNYRNDFFNKGALDNRFKIFSTTKTTPLASIDMSGDGVVEVNSSFYITSTALATAPANVDAANVFAKVIVDSSYDPNKASGNYATVQLKAFENRRVESYVDVKVLNYDRRDNFTPGTKVKFDFSGKAIRSGDKVEIEFDSPNGLKPQVGLVTQGFNEDLTNIVKTSMPNAKNIVVSLYDTNTTAIIYHIKSIKVNGSDVIYKTIEDDRDTDNIYEWSKDVNISVYRYREKGAGLIQINSIDTASDASNTGKDARELKGISPAIVTKPTKDKLIVYKDKLYTNIYYKLFSSATDLKILDMYGNDLDVRYNEIDRNFNLKATDGMDVDMARGTDAYIKFNNNAIGKTQILTVYFVDKPSIYFDIKFTNIEFATEQNSKFFVTMDIGNQNYNVVNTEFVIKIKPNGHNDQVDTNLVFKHSDNSAKLRVMKIDSGGSLSSRFYDTILNLQNSTSETISKDGSFYIVTADKPGNLSIVAKSVIPSRDSTTRREEVVEGSMNVKIVPANSVRPTINPITDVKVIKDKITVKITDPNLDISKTRVRLFNKDNVFIKNAIFEGGIFIFPNLSNGVYRIDINAISFSKQDYSASYARYITNSTIAGNTNTNTTNTGNLPPQLNTGTTNTTKPAVNANSVFALESALVKKQNYKIVGMFFPYDFPDKPSYLDFAYLDYSTNKIYQFQGTTPTDTNKFGFVEVKLRNIVLQDDYSFYMIQLDGNKGSADAKGPLGWVLFNKKTFTKVSKLTGVGANGTFTYQDLNLKAINLGNKLIKFQRK